MERIDDRTGWRGNDFGTPRSSVRALEPVMIDEIVDAVAAVVGR